MEERWSTRTANAMEEWRSARATDALEVSRFALISTLKRRKTGA